MAKYNEKHEEIGDPTPVAVPIGYRVPETLEAKIARMVRVMSERASQIGVETFEESDDFDVEDDGDEKVLSKYELSEMEEQLPTYREKRVKEKVEKDVEEVVKKRASRQQESANAHGSEPKKESTVST